ncbi:S9 family peptidase [Candidatus Uhrbacteria bacterium]|nr:S9 family peptidase [Candidatus Uhrbacteria bacterium]
MSLYSIQDFLETKTAWAPSWSPDATKLLYISNLTGVAQAYLKDLASGEVRQLTDGTEPIEFAFFPPKENVILFGHSNGGNERTQIRLMDPTNGKSEWLMHNDEFIYRVTECSADGSLFAYISNERNGKDFDVYVYNLKKRESRRVFDRGGWCKGVGFSPDKTMLVVRIEYTFSQNQLVLVNLQTGEELDVTEKEGLKEHGYAHWLPDGSGFYFKNNQDRDFSALDFYDLKNKSITPITGSLDLPKFELEIIRMTLDGGRLLLGYNRDGYTDVWFMDVATKQLTKALLPDGELDGFEWTEDGSRLAFEFEDAKQQRDIWILEVSGSVVRATESPRRVPVDVCQPMELVRYESFDGKQIPAFIYTPKRKGNERCPVIVNVHGGPEGQSRPGFYGLMQYFVSQGWAVVLPNIRGSSGYGKEYMAADDKGKRWDSIKDIEWLNKYLRSRDDVDPEKIVIMGGSYGGYMTLVGVAFQPKLWAAGVDIVGMSNLVTFLQNTSVWRRALREAEYGSLQDDHVILEDLSPMRVVKDIQAPLLVIHGANDPRVPLSEAEQIVKTVVDQGGVAELLVYHDEGHGLAKLQNRLDAYPKVADFLTKHVIEKR